MCAYAYITHNSIDICDSENLSCEIYKCRISVNILALREKSITGHLANIRIATGLRAEEANFRLAGTQYICALISLGSLPSGKFKMQFFQLDCTIRIYSLTARYGDCMSYR